MKNKFLLFIVVLLTACSEGGGNSSLENNYVVLGDSNCDPEYTSSIGVTKTWPQQLGLEFDCIAGRPLWDLDLNQLPDKIILALGTNDYWFGRKSDDFSLNYQQVLSRVNEAICVMPINNAFEDEVRSHCSIVVITPPPDHDYTHGGQLWHDEVARRVEVWLDD